MMSEVFVHRSRPFRVVSSEGPLVDDVHAEQVGRGHAMSRVVVEDAVVGAVGELENIESGFEAVVPLGLAVGR